MTMRKEGMMINTCRLKGRDLKENHFIEKEGSSFQDFGQCLIKKIRECNGDNTVK